MWVVNFVLRHNKFSLFLIIHNLYGNQLFTEITLCPHIFLAYSSLGYYALRQVTLFLTDSLTAVISYFLLVKRIFFCCAGNFSLGQVTKPFWIFTEKFLNCNFIFYTSITKKITLSTVWTICFTGNLPLCMLTAPYL